MIEQRFYTPLKVGLLVVAAAYFLFTLHGMFTLSWIGEWDRIGGGAFGTMILVEDISATIGLVFRFIASLLAFAAVMFYFAKRGMAKPTAYKVLRWVLVFEAIYWLGLIATAGYSIQGFGLSLLRQRPLDTLLYTLAVSVIPTVMEAIVLPITLFKFAYTLNPDKPYRNSIKWGLIAGTVLIAVFWLINTSMWVSVIREKGIDYLWLEVVKNNGVETTILHPEHLVSFVITTVGLLALAIYTGMELLQGLRFRAVGAIITSLGLYFIWNYFSWVAFAGATWNSWYAWFLGHNMDLWMLALPLVGLPLLFYMKPVNQQAPVEKN